MGEFGVEAEEVCGAGAEERWKAVDAGEGFGEGAGAEEIRQVVVGVSGVEVVADFEMGEAVLDVLFPVAPGFEEEEEAAGGGGVVGHVAGGFGDDAVGPREHIVDQVLVGVDDGVLVEDANAGFGVV